ncbi:SDR family oxidoreductase [Micrococcoides hystricis]|uniref:SDR family oxidoreductase n=1 Tax=Micrococcoides hystricis TaxID=1572761 RepID=A0ABV6PBS6_9MICC
MKQAGALVGRTILMSGGSRGIGLAIALRAAADGANVAMVAKSATAHPNLPGTIFTAAEEIEAAGGAALPIVGDVRNEGSIAAAVEQTVERFGGIDIVINNASAIDLRNSQELPPKRYDLMQDINVRGSYLLTAAAVPQLRAAAQKNPGGAHVLTLSPPLNLKPHWFKDHTAYTMSKYGMSMTTIGFAAELADAGVGVNSLWPATLIDTAAIRNMPGGQELVKRGRKPEIVADAAWHILTSDGRQTSGNFFIDDQVLSEAGVTDFGDYAVEPGAELMVDAFLD